jgi:hypothetical protein
MSFSGLITPISHSGVLTSAARRLVESDLGRYGFTAPATQTMIRETGIKIGGGFTTNALVAEAGHAVKPLPTGADIDFYVNGCFCPPMPESYDWATWSRTNTSLLFNNPEAASYFEACDAALHRKSSVLKAFKTFAANAGYTHVPATDADIAGYVAERTVDGDRLFTTTSMVQYVIYFFRRTSVHGETQTLNLVMVDAPLATIQTKVDIGLTAGLLSADGLNRWTYMHPAPKDVNDLRVAWLQPEATHTDRQMLRLKKYAERYDTRASFTFKVPEFLKRYDTLPEKCDVTLIVKPSELTPALKRRAHGITLAGTIVFVHVSEDAGEPATSSAGTPAGGGA